VIAVADFDVLCDLLELRTDEAVDLIRDVVVKIPDSPLRDWVVTELGAITGLPEPVLRRAEEEVWA
jgi:hypothetical protein